MARVGERTALGVYLDIRMRAMRLSQVDLAVLLQVNQGTVSRWFTTDKLPSNDRLLRLAQVLNADPEKVFRLAGRRYEPFAIDNTTPAVVLRLLHLLDGRVSPLSPPQRATLESSLAGLLALVEHQAATAEPVDQERDDT